MLQLSRHVQKLPAVGGNVLDAAPQGAVLPQAGRSGAPQGRLAQVQNVSGQLNNSEGQSSASRRAAAAAVLRAT